jgi:hypothetical protein
MAFRRSDIDRFATNLLNLLPVTDVDRPRNEELAEITVQNTRVLEAQLLRGGRELRRYPVQSADARRHPGQPSSGADGCAVGPEYCATVDYRRGTGIRP